MSTLEPVKLDSSALEKSIQALVDAMAAARQDTRKLEAAAQRFDTARLEAAIGTLAGEIADVRQLAQTAVVNVRNEQPSRYTNGEIASSTSSTVLFSDNPKRMGATVYNSSTAILYVKLGTEASSSSFNVALAALTGGIGGYYEVPGGYTGPVTGVWASANGSAKTAELSL